jgi:hypothetical protein
VKTNEKKLSRAARIKLARSAKRTAKKRAIKRKLLAKRMKSPAKLKKVADKAAKNILVKKLAGGKKYQELSLSQKEFIDKKLATKTAVINKISRKLLPKVKQKEKERIKKVRSKINNKNAVNENKHGVFTLGVNGSKLEVSAQYINGKLKPFSFKSKKEAIQHKKNVGGKIFQSPKTNIYYVEFTKLDGPITEKSVSKSQQRLFGMVHAYNKGDLKKTDVDTDLYTKIKKIANGMTKKDAKKMAKTDHDDLPNKVPTNEGKEEQENLKDLKAILDVAKMLSDKSPYFKGRGSKKEYIKMLVHKIKKLSEAKQKKLLTKLDAYNKVRKQTMPKSRPMKSKKSYDRKDFKKGKYD